MSIWSTLSAIDCGEHVEKKGQFSYLAWTWAWAMVKQHYPSASYFLEDDIRYPDGTMEVRVTVNISTGPRLTNPAMNAVANGGEEHESLSHTMWLPVLDFKNKAIQNPNAFDINSSRMRCLVKCLAMFGLGHYIYAGESVPQEPKATDEQFKQLVKLVAEKDAMGVRVFSDQIGPDLMTSVFNMAEAGKKTKFKDEVREMYRQSRELVKALAEGFTNSVESDSMADFREMLDEMDDRDWPYVMGAMSETEVSNFKAYVAENNVEGVPDGV